MSIRLNDTTRRALQFIDEYHRRCGYMPTIRDIMDNTQIVSTSVVRHHLNQLQRLGMISFVPRRARSIALLPPAQRFLRPIKQVALTLPYPVSVNAAYVPIGRGKLVLSAEAKQYKRDAGWEAVIAFRAKHDEPLTGELGLSVYLFRPRDSGDIDNPLKLMHDALNGILWNDDAQIVEEHLYKRIDADSPRVEISVWEVAHADAD